MAAITSRTTPASPDVETEAEFSYEVSNTGNNSMKVVVRVRPESEPELRSSCQCVVKVVDEHVLIFDPADHQTSGPAGDSKKPFLMSSPGMSRFFGGRRLRPLLAKKHKDLRFAFDHVFDETSTQSQIFQHTTQVILDGVLDGINCSVFAYGATGAGKTHTMLGSPEEPGVIFLTMRELYRRIDALRDSKTCSISISYCEAHRVGRVDAFIQSSDKNLMVPVGGAIVASSNEDFIVAVSQTYPGRASSSPVTDVFITLLSLGYHGYHKLVQQRKDVYEYLRTRVGEVMSEYGERVLATPHNPISMAVSLSCLSLSSIQWTELGAILFAKQVSGIRVIAPGSSKSMGPHSLVNWGAHTEEYPTPYFTVAAAIGMTRDEVDQFCLKLDKTFKKFTKKHSSRAATLGIPKTGQEEVEEKGSSRAAGQEEVEEKGEKGEEGKDVRQKENRL